MNIKLTKEEVELLLGCCWDTIKELRLLELNYNFNYKEEQNKIEEEQNKTKQKNIIKLIEKVKTKQTKIMKLIDSYNELLAKEEGV